LKKKATKYHAEGCKLKTNLAAFATTEAEIRRNPFLGEWNFRLISICSHARLIPVFNLDKPEIPHGTI
jgi:hypothetical protein